MERAQEVVHAILKSHHANETNDRVCLFPQIWVRLNLEVSLRFDTVAYDGDALLGDVVAFDLDLFVGLVCGDDMIGDNASKSLQPDEGTVDDRGTAVWETCPIHLRG